MFFLMTRPPPLSTLFPYTTLFRSLFFSRGLEIALRFFKRCLQLIEIIEIGKHTSELQSHHDLVCRLLLEKKKTVSLILHYVVSLRLSLLWIFFLFFSLIVMLLLNH